MTTHTPNPHLTCFRRSAALLLTLAVLFGAESIRYPDNFRRWVHVSTGVILPGAPLPESEQGMHHTFANQKAAAGYSSGDFADGSVIVYELREAQDKNGIISEGGRKRVDVMIKDSSLYQNTGGWRFERFMGNDQSQDALHDSGTSCFECHTSAKAHGFVFSQLH
jgi:hypothetical protein